MKLGIDIASVDGNGDPDWEKAKSEGHLSFVIIRAAYGNAIDPDFGKYWAQAKQHGITRGAYLFLRFNKMLGGTPEEQVDTMLLAIGKIEPTDLPPTIDLEFPNGRAFSGFTADEAMKWFMRARKHFKAKTGFEAMTYSSYVVWVDPDGMANAKAPELADTPGWWKYWPWPIHHRAITDPVIIDALHPPPVPPPWGTSWMAEQIMGDAILFPGFVATVDVNRFNVLRQGSTGGFVSWTQRRVGATPDGIYGPNTARQVGAFQRMHGLRPDEEVGPLTFCQLAQVVI